MREYKFRGKYVECNKWVYGCYVKGTREGEAYILKNHDGYWSWSDIWFAVYSETVGQFTGLKDKNGKEIYEGDILRHKWNCGYNKWLETISIVKWHKGAFVVDDKKRADWLLSLHACADNWAEVEVIGNRWDNPELLKEVEA